MSDISVTVMIALAGGILFSGERASLFLQPVEAEGSGTAGMESSWTA